MPRYKPPKITHEQAAGELRRAYDQGYAIGLAGCGSLDVSDLWGEWNRQINARKREGCRDGYREFVKRVCAAKCGELPPPSPPPKVTFNPGYIYGKTGR